MQRSLRVTVAATAAAGITALCAAGPAWAAGAGAAGPGGHGYLASHDDDHDGHHGCPTKFDKKQPASKEDDFPSDHSPEADANSTPQDARDTHGDPYFTRNQECTTPGPKTKKDPFYKTFNNKPGQYNTYDSQEGWDPDRYKRNNYGANRCFYQHLGPDKLKSDNDNGHSHDLDNTKDRGKDCQFHTDEVRKDDRKYGPDLKKVNYGDNGYGKPLPQPGHH